MTAAHRTKEFAAAKARIKPALQAQINAGSGWCHNGGHVLTPGTPWDVSHIVDVAVMRAAGIPEHQWHLTSNLTSSCRHHNRSAGGKAGAKKQQVAKATNEGLLPW